MQRGQARRREQGDLESSSEVEVKQAVPERRR